MKKDNNKKTVKIKVGNVCKQGGTYYRKDANGKDALATSYLVYGKIDFNFVDFSILRDLGAESIGTLPHVSFYSTDPLLAENKENKDIWYQEQGKIRNEHRYGVVGADPVINDKKRMRSNVTFYMEFPEEFAPQQEEIGGYEIYWQNEGAMFDANGVDTRCTINKKGEIFVNFNADSLDWGNSRYFLRAVYFSYRVVK
ncbi:MAG: hypothetical protein J6J36_00875 [Clostridia bacterium]|nr:hypothetical protein [Clostridia bacterium]